MEKYARQRSSPANHAFVVPAYGLSPYLEQCLESLRLQTMPSSILITTSTPSPGLLQIAQRYDIEVRVNLAQGHGIGTDWNFALANAGAPWVTLAHQDDVYDQDYSSEVMAAIERHPDAVLVSTGYRELLGSAIRPRSLLLGIKRGLMELGFAGTERASSRWRKLNTLRFGCAIPCPSVAFNIERTGLRFSTALCNNLDWAAWIALAQRDGAFVYLRRALMSHRVHADSETSAGLMTGQRVAEDCLVLRGLWPEFIARLIARTYGIAYRSNRE